jgi:hypothetical protein
MVSLEPLLRPWHSAMVWTHDNAWYLNKPKEGDKPNVRCNEKLIFSALHDIKAGEELITDYDTYSERPS